MGTKESTPQAPSAPAPTSYVANGIEVSLADRWLILGATGTGKTTFVRHLLDHLSALYRNMVPLYVLDTKGVGDFAHLSNFVTTDAPPRPITSGHQVWQPGLETWEAFDAWFGALLAVPGALILNIDEVSSITDHSGKGPDNYARLLKQGRGMNKCVITCTQEMAGVPRQIKGQATHVVRFRLADDYDRVKGNRLMGLDKDTGDPRGRYGFFYRRIDRGGPVFEYHGWQEFF
jgi:hypothetical protein